MDFNHEIKKYYTPKTYVTRVQCVTTIFRKFRQKNVCIEQETIQYNSYL